jgi:hypothetical protein
MAGGGGSQIAETAGRTTTTGLFGRAPASPKTAPAPAPLVEWLLWWSWSRFEKRLAKRLHQLD